MRAFVSSTYEDLADYRRVVEESLASSGIEYNAMEHFGSRTNPAIEVCLHAVAQSQVFIGILGLRYGSTPPHGIQSYTEREYRHAKKLGLPILMFLIDVDNATVLPKHFMNESADSRQRLTKLKAEVSRNHMPTLFTSPDSLARLVLSSLIREVGIMP